MSTAARKLEEDKTLRDAALAVFQADIRFVKEDLAARSVGGRIADRLGDSALDMVDDAMDYAESNKGQVAAAITAALVWFARIPILNGVADLFDLNDEDDEEEQAGLEDRSQDD